MKIASVFFDDIVVIPGAKDGGSAVPPQDLRESSFHARDGWAITMEPHGVFRLFREPMKGPCTVGGYGFTIVAAEDGDSARINEIADRLEAQGVPPTAAMKQAVDAVLGPEDAKPAGKRRRK